MGNYQIQLWNSFSPPLPQRKGTLLQLPGAVLQIKRSRRFPNQIKVIQIQPGKQEK